MERTQTEVLRDFKTHFLCMKLFSSSDDFKQVSKVDKYCILFQLEFYDIMITVYS